MTEGKGLEGGEERKPLEERVLPWTDDDGVQIDIPALIVFDNFYHGEYGLNRSLDAYLSQCPRYIEPELQDPMFADRTTTELQITIHASVLRLLTRMAASKETKEDFMSPEYFSELIYYYRIFTIPRIIHICALFGRDNYPVTLTMIQHVLKSQPLFLTQFKSNFLFMLELMHKCETEMETSAGEKTKILRKENNDFDKSVITSAVTFSLDLAYSLKHILSIIPSTIPFMIQVGVPLRLTQFYQIVYTNGIQAISSKTGGFGFGVNDKLNGRLQYFETIIMDMLHCIIDENCIKPIVTGKKPAYEKLYTEVSGDAPKTDIERFENYVEIRTGILKDAQENKFPFAALFDSKYPLSDELDRLRAKDFKLSREKEDELKFLYEKAKLKMGFDAWKYLLHNNILNRKMLKSLIPEYRSVIECVQEIFPSYSDGFMMTAASHFKHRKENLLDALLQNKLPKYLRYYRLIADQEKNPLVIQMYQKWTTDFPEIMDPNEFDSLEAARTKTKSANSARTVTTAEDPAIYLSPHPDKSNMMETGTEKVELDFDQYMVNVWQQNAYPTIENVELQRLPTGKKHQAGKWTDRDRTEVNKLRDFYKRFEEETPTEEEELARMYEDDYDDTYDGMADMDSNTGDTFAKRRVKPPMPRTLGGWSSGVSASGFGEYQQADNLLINSVDDLASSDMSSSQSSFVTNTDTRSGMNYRGGGDISNRRGASSGGSYTNRDGPRGGYAPPATALGSAMTKQGVRSFRGAPDSDLQENRNRETPVLAKHKEKEGPEENNTQQADGHGIGRGAALRGGRGGARGGGGGKKDSYTGGRDRQRKEQHSAHHRKDRAQAKQNRGMF